MYDPRAVPLIAETWKATLPVAEKWRRGSGYLIEWSSWRQLAAATLGGADEEGFLDEQAKATKDRYVARACRDGAAAIRARLASKL